MFYNIAAKKFKIIHVTHIILLLSNVGIDQSKGQGEGQENSEIYCLIFEHNTKITKKRSLLNKKHFPQSGLLQ